MEKNPNCIRGTTMLNNKWFCEPNPYRETYCYFLLETEKQKKQPKIIGWKAAIGNIDEITNRLDSKNQDETETLKNIIPVLFYCRKKYLTIITDKKETVSLLRTRLAMANIENTDLSSIRVISLEEYFNKYFSYTGENGLLSWCKFLSIDANKKKKTELIKSVYARIKPFIPKGE
jgi:hypothetical protein